MFIREKRRGGEKMNKKCVWKCWTNEGGDPCAVLDVCALGGREITRVLLLLKIMVKREDGQSNGYFFAEN